MREKWGNKFNMVRAGNEKGDQLAQEGTNKETSPLYSRLVDKETDIGVYHKGQWVDTSICKHLTQIKNSNYARDQKERVCEGITDPKRVAWKVAFTITHKPNFKDDTNARTIHKLRTKHSSSTNISKTAGEEDAAMKQSKRALPHAPYAHQQIKKWRRALLTSWERVKLLKKSGKKLS